jgi:signal transduction histidine kinase
LTQVEAKRPRSGDGLTAPGAGAPGAAGATAGPAGGLDQLFGDLTDSLHRLAGGGWGDTEGLLHWAESALATLYEETWRRERWLVAAGEITTALLAGGAPGLVLPMIAARARELARADCATVLVPVRGGPETCLTMAAVDAIDSLQSHVLLGAQVPMTGSVSGRVFRDGISLIVDDLAAMSPPATTATGTDFGPAVAVPLASKGTRLGALMVLRVAGAPAFPPETLDVTQSFASQAALALHLAETQRTERRLALLEDRERIAVDLQDNLIQRLFATGMLVESVSRRLDSPVLREKLDRAAHALDVTIRDTRKTIHSLQMPLDPDHPELRQRLLAAIEEATAATSLSPSVHLDGPLDALVPLDIADGAVEVIRKAVSDVVRHGAKSISVTVTASDALAVTVADDVPTPVQQDWLQDLSDRAAEFGGALTVDRSAAAGSRLEWKVPLC